MKTNIVIDISSTIPYLAKFCLSNYGPKCCQPIKSQDSLKCNISRKKLMMKCIFGMQINIEVFYKLILSFWVYPGMSKLPKIICLLFLCKILISMILIVIIKHSQSSQNSKFQMCLRYLQIACYKLIS